MLQPNLKESSLNLLRRYKRAFTHKLKTIVIGTSQAKVKLVVIGAQKGGTTALYNYLSLHPQIEAPDNKELNFFNGVSEQALHHANYLSLFPKRIGRNEKFHSIDVSPSYLIDASFVAQRIYQIDKTIKIVAILREPVSRAVSSWFMYKKLAQKNPDWFIESGWVKNNKHSRLERRKQFGVSFLDDINEEIDILNQGKRVEFPIVEYGLYAQQLEHYFNYFGKENVTILFSHELKENTQECLNTLYRLIGIAPYVLNDEKLIPHFVGDNKVELPEHELEQLKGFYTAYNDDLSVLLEQPLPWSS